MLFNYRQMKNEINEIISIYLIVHLNRKVTSKKEATTRECHKYTIDERAAMTKCRRFYALCCEVSIADGLGCWSSNGNNFECIVQKCIICKIKTFAAFILEQQQQQSNLHRIVWACYAPVAVQILN